MKHIIIIDHPNSYTDYYNINSQNEYENKIITNLKSDKNVQSVHFLYPDGEYTENFEDKYGPYKTRHFQTFSEKLIKEYLRNIPKADDVEIQLNAHGKTGMPRFELRCRDDKFLHLSELAKIVNAITASHGANKTSFHSNSCNFMTDEDSSKYYNLMLPLPFNRKIYYIELPPGSTAGNLTTQLDDLPKQISGANYYSFTLSKLNTWQISQITATTQSSEKTKPEYQFLNQFLQYFNGEMQP